MVGGVDDAFDTEFCIDNSDNNFVEERGFGRDFVAGFGNSFYGDEFGSVGNLYAGDGDWWVEFVGGEK